MDVQPSARNPAPAEIHPGTRMGAVALTVANLERQLRFYQEVLGLRLHRRVGPTAAVGAGGEDLLRLTENPNAPRLRGATGLYHFAVLVPDRKELARVLARLYSSGYRHHPTDHVMTETTYLSDPEGNGIEIYADTPERGTWGVFNGTFGARTSDGAITSGRDPLDVESLLSLLGAEDRIDVPMPAQTKIGHVHLHVSRLAPAVRFYHEVVGFQVMSSLPEAGAAFVSAGGYHHHLGLNTWLGEGAPTPPPGVLGLLYYTIVVPTRGELDRIGDRLDRAGDSLLRSDDGLLVRDPSSNRVWITDRADSSPE
ncbi:MAG TPA: VOC family protein [Anaerolineales bacterium]|nr:VOC family protein [Anaerolineales bacterium]